MNIEILIDGQKVGGVITSLSIDTSNDFNTVSMFGQSTPVIENATQTYSADLTMTITRAGRDILMNSVSSGDRDYLSYVEDEPVECVESELTQEEQWISDLEDI